jgi:hypothetical protein
VPAPPAPPVSGSPAVIIGLGVETEAGRGVGVTGVGVGVGVPAELLQPKPASESSPFSRPNASRSPMGLMIGIPGRLGNHLSE